MYSSKRYAIEWLTSHPVIPAKVGIRMERLNGMRQRTREPDMEISKDLIAASATPLILSILSGGESYGYALIKQVRDLSAGEMQWTDGMLYPVLHRLEKQGLVESETRPSEQGRTRKYYRIKHQGTHALNVYKAQWQTVYSTLQKVWENKPCLT